MHAPAPVGFGVVGRSWQPRLRHAGTYDARWVKERLPFFPEDFDEHYFLGAPEDQQLPRLRGGEAIRCTHMTPDGSFMARVPQVDVPATFRFRDRDVDVSATLDTIILEPSRRRLLALWRTCVRLGKKLNALQAVMVGKRRWRV